MACSQGMGATATEADPRRIRALTSRNPPGPQAHPSRARGIGRCLPAGHAYDENEEAGPPGAQLADLAIALQVSADELLGLKPLKAKTSPKRARLLKRLETIDTLPPGDQRAILKFVDALVASKRPSG